MARPVIAVTTYREHASWGVWRRPADLLGTGYADAVLAAGGAPVLLPPLPDAVPAVLDAVDGVVLAGGADLDPGLYDAPRDPATGAPRPDRDAAELAVAQACVERGLPLLAVCRGMQVLDVALGGTLCQHLPSIEGTSAHRGADGEFTERTVHVAPQSRLAAVVGTSLAVHCYHHQALDRIGEGLTPVAWSEDGVVEAVEHDGPGFVLGVQSHPEESEDRRLFSALVRAAADRRG
jgi:gamma-glutamyl-gamma-aminobutyrate hydrolase PuuD